MPRAPVLTVRLNDRARHDSLIEELTHATTTHDGRVITCDCCGALEFHVAGIIINVAMADNPAAMRKH